MAGGVAQIGGVPDIWVTKAQLANHPRVEKSIRWVEQQLESGLPSELRRVRGQSRRMFHLPTALAWIAERHDGLGVVATEPTDRVKRPSREKSEARRRRRIASRAAAGRSDPERQDGPAKGAPPKTLSLEERVATLESRTDELEGRKPPAA